MRLLAIVPMVFAIGCYNLSGDCELNFTCPDDATTTETSTGAVNSCDGEDPENFCDDCNPCTSDAFCTLCKYDGKDVPHCTPPSEAPPYCGGLVGCQHYDRTTMPGQLNDCFPVDTRDHSDPHAGRCCDGACIENNAICSIEG